jgi:predicted nuclease of predicted toxin-antitoxin system
MKIMVDENIPLSTVAELRGMGHDVLDIRGTDREGIDDAEVWRVAQEGERLLVTTDKGFAKHRFESHHGILIIRLRQPNRQRIHERVMEAMSRVPEDEWGSLLVSMRDRLHSLWHAESGSRAD